MKKLTVVSSPKCGGTVTYSPELCPNSTYALNTPVTLTAMPSEGCQFERWTGDVDGVGDTENSTITVVMSQDRVITVNFTAPGGLYCDNTPPSTPVVTDDGVYTTDGTQLHVTWTSSDNDSGIAEYQYAVGTSPGAADVVGWESAATATEITHTGLSLTPGTAYYISVKAGNGAGLWSEVGSSDGIVCDNTPPTTPVVSDDGDHTTANAQLHVTWTSSDNDSGIAEYQYAVGTSPGAADAVGWESAGTAIEITHTGLSLTPGTAYYISVEAKNGAGLWSEVGSADGIVLRTTGLPLFGWIGIGVAAAVLMVGAVAYLVMRRGAAKP